MLENEIKTLESVCCLMHCPTRVGLDVKLSLKEIEMERRFGLYIVLGLVIGGVFGLGLGAANGNAALGIALGAIGGLFVGWFVAAAALEKRNAK